MRGPGYWLWLAGSEGLHARALDSWPEGEKETLEALKRQGASEKRLAALTESLASRWAEAEYERLEKIGAQFVSCEDEAYPEGLRDLEEPPLGLWVLGTVPTKRSVGVVGTRRCSPYGGSVAGKVGSALAQSDLPLVSGGAQGIDSAAHSGCLEAGGVTLAVLGTGLDKLWPPEHGELFSRIVEGGGALVSEYALGTPGRPWRFPRRNRIIAALSSVLVVVESGHKGGAMITAGLAMGLGRELWAVPGRIDEEVSRGSNQLIADGASPLVDVGAFIESLTGSAQLDLFQSPSLTAEEASVFEAVCHQSDQTADSLALKTGLSPMAVLTAISSLEIKGLVVTLASRVRRR